MLKVKYLSKYTRNAKAPFIVWDPPISYLSYQQLQKFKAENEKLKSENRALTRVVSKLTAAATKTGSAVVPRK